MSEFKANPKLRALLTDPTKPYIHRDLSWLQFNERVLAEAADESNPLLERLKFLAISANNLDEFFMIRIAGLGRSIAAEMRKGKNGEQTLRRLRRIRSTILESVAESTDSRAKIFHDLARELAVAGIHLVTDPRSSGTAYALGKKVFDERILPELDRPELFAPNQLNLLENLQIAILFGDGAWLRVPRKLRSVVTAKDDSSGDTYVFFLDRILMTYAGAALGLHGDPVAIRLTRDADLSVEIDEEDTESIPDVVLTSLKTRDFGRPVRLQYYGPESRELLRYARDALKLSPQQVFRMPITNGLHRLWSVVGELPEKTASGQPLSLPPIRNSLPADLLSNLPSIFEHLKKRDFLLHHPYDSFDAYVEFVRVACADPDVTMIQQTVYRMDALSPVIEALKAAAATKRVRVVIELRARFDELNNLRLSDELRKAGVEVAFGFGKLKLHAKVALVTRKENGVERLYTHLSTGNYNAHTSRLYTDLAILTANEDIGADAAHFFASVCKGEVPSQFRKLVHAPTKLHRRILQLIDSEIATAKSGQPARIIAKINTLVDDTVIEKLYSASQAGVKIDLIVRGACSLIPGLRGLSENIRVVSIVDRFLEHSRIYYFESSRAMYLSSADWMQRNFFSRLELAYPIYDDALYAFIERVLLPTYLSDNAKGRELQSDGSWKRRSPDDDAPALRAQFYFEQLALTQYMDTPLA